MLAARLMMGACDAGSSTTAPGHPGVAAWVTANSGDVAGYWPLDDASASGTMADSGPNSIDGTYGSGMTSSTIDGEAAANFDAASTDRSQVAYNAAMDGARAMFAVIEIDTTAANQQIVSRDDATAGNRVFQFRVDSGGKISLLRLVGGGTATSTTTLSTGTRYTVGWWVDAANNRIRLYVNGVEEATITATALSGTSSKLTFGYKDAALKDDLNGRIASVVLLDSTASYDNPIPDLHDAWVNGYTS